MPQMQFSTLVLPAPFGPMSASSSPGATAAETSASTVRPPKASVIRSSSSAGGSAIPAPRPAVLLHVAIAAARADAAQIELLDVGVRPQAGGLAVEHDAPVLE